MPSDAQLFYGSHDVLCGKGASTHEIKAEARSILKDQEELLKDTKKLADMDLATLRAELNKQILAGSYDTPLGKISFTPEGEIKQEQFYVAQIKMDADGANGQFTFVK